MSILTKERLQQLADENTICKVSRDERIAMARQLLAGLEQEQEPVAWVRYCSDGTIDGPLLNYQIDDCRKPSWSPLYAAPQLPQPAPGDGRDQFEEWFKFHHGDEHSIIKLHRAKSGANYRDQYVDLAWIAWKDSRAAMLQGAEPVSQPYTLPTGFVAVPVEPTESMIIAGFEAELREEFRDPEAYEAFEAMSGCEQAALRAKWCWAAMITAEQK